MCWMRSVASNTQTSVPVRRRSSAAKNIVLPLAIDVVGLLQEDALVGDAFVERPGVLGESERRVRADPLGQVRRVVERVRHRHRRLLGIEVDRRHVQREVLAHLDDEQTRDARDRRLPGAARNRSVTQSLSRPGASATRVPPTVDVRPLRATDRARCAAARASGRAVGRKRILRPLDCRLDAIAVDA